MSRNITEITIPSDNECKDAINTQDAGDKTVLGLRTGFDIDRIITDIRPGELFVLAGRPSFGKTSLMINIALNMALGNEHASIGIFSLECYVREIVARMLSSLTRISINDFQGQQILGSLNKAAEKLCKSKILIEDAGSIDITNLCAKARRMRYQHGVHAIFIDYLGLIKTSDMTDASSPKEELAMISSQLKALAEELEIPVILLTQLYKSIGINERPTLADLRKKSGNIEQDADIIAFLHRELPGWSPKRPLPVELIIAKNRHGSCDTVNLNFFPEYFLFENAPKSAT